MAEAYGAGGQQSLSSGEAVLPPRHPHGAHGQTLVPYQGPALELGQWYKDKEDLPEGLTLKIVPGGK